MKSDSTVYAYRMPENRSVDDGEFNEDILASKNIDIQLKDRFIPGAVVFMRIPEAEFKAALRDKSSGIHSSEETREHFRKLLTSQGNSAETVDKALARIDDDYSNNKGSDKRIRREQKKSSSYYAARLRDISADKLRQLLAKPTSQPEKEKRIPAKTFEIVTAKAINAGKLPRVNENGVAYTYKEKTNKSGESVQTASKRTLSEKSTDALPVKHGRHSITRKAHIRPDSPALRQSMQTTSSAAAQAPATTSPDDSNKQTNGSNAK